jgi:DNA-binding MarR family transcriptional regulator
MAAPTSASSAASAAPPSAAQELDTSYLETLVGYNTRRATLAIVEVFMDRMAAYGLSIVDFSVLSLVGHNPGATSRQLCATLGILPPNLVGIIASLDKRGLIDRRPHPTDGRALGLHLTDGGLALLRQAEATAASLEDDATRNLGPAERATLIRLLQKIYR